MNRLLLLATESRVIQEVCQNFAEQLGYELHLAGNGLECCDQLLENAPDVLLLDSQLRLWGGAEGVLDRMRDDPQHFAVPVLWITEENNSDALPETVTDPIVGCLTLPSHLSLPDRNLQLVDSHLHQACLEPFFHG